MTLLATSAWAIATGAALFITLLLGLFSMSRWRSSHSTPFDMSQRDMQQLFGPSFALQR
jgi:hypothetical protein